jgi:hypothetical protein
MRKITANSKLLPGEQRHPNFTDQSLVELFTGKRSEGDSIWLEVKQKRGIEM